MTSTRVKSRPRPNRVPAPEEACSWVYGPVPSRRFGLSLGINLGEIHEKICTWGCVYCQCGFGRKREQVPDARFPSTPQVLEQVERYLTTHPDLESITFAGNSEPTSNPEFPEIVDGVLKLRARHGGVPRVINCLTNGSDIGRPGVLQALRSLDEAWLKLDCAIDSLYSRLNRPEPSLGGLDRHLERMRLFGPGLLIQTLVWECGTVPHLANWTPENREALTQTWFNLKPRRIHLATIERNPADRRLTPVADPELLDFAAFLRQKSFDVTVFPSRGTKKYVLNR